MNRLYRSVLLLALSFGAVLALRIYMGGVVEISKRQAQLETRPGDSLEVTATPAG